MYLYLFGKIKRYHEICVQLKNPDIFVSFQYCIVIGISEGRKEKNVKNNRSNLNIPNKAIKATTLFDCITNIILNPLFCQLEQTQKPLAFRVLSYKRLRLNIFSRIKKGI